MTSKPQRFSRLSAGEPAPYFTGRETNNPRYVFDTAAGRYMILCFFGSSQEAPAKAIFSEVLEKHRSLFDEDKFAFFGVTGDPRDEAQQSLQASLPGIRFFYDSDLAIARLYGAAPLDVPEQGGPVPIHCKWFVLDPTMRILKIIPFRPDGQDRRDLIDYMQSLPPVARFAGIELQAPIIYLPGIFEPELCEELIGLYRRTGGVDSGFMRDVDGKTVEIKDYGRKSRRDYIITEEPVLKELNARIIRRIVPEIKKVHQFTVSRIERHIVACYSAEDKGHFAAHRDDTTKGTAHRRFAVTINLNNEFEGGELSFPEYGPRSFKPPPGGAVVFSCSLLHKVSQVTKGERFAFLPFLYDEAARKVREANMKYLATAGE
jgi:predicted 2-oxoglutarate/Fe(II)-dependent dioxygenase YbiX/peroxiredoxin